MAYVVRGTGASQFVCACAMVETLECRASAVRSMGALNDEQTDERQQCAISLRGYKRPVKLRLIADSPAPEYAS
jgi:hypothetical protein